MAEVKLSREPLSLSQTRKDCEKGFEKYMGEWNSFKWMNEDKDKIPPHLDAGKGLLEAWLKDVDEKAQSKEGARSELPELQTEYRMMALNVAIHWYSDIKDAALERAKLYKGQANTRCQLEAMNANNYITTLTNLKKAIALNKENGIESSLADVYDNTNIQQGFASALNKTTDDFLKGKIGSSNTSLALGISGEKVSEVSQDAVALTNTNTKSNG